MFQRDHLSPVGELALALLIFHEGQQKKKRESDEVRLALLTATGRTTYFPEHFGEFDPDSGVLIDDGSNEADTAISKAKRAGEISYDYSGVDWTSPTHNSEELNDLMRLQSALLGAESIAITDED